ncbi:unnamed protein product [Rhizophagus irregularis]|nr:unnamed protein product [Rhizophagus irregularis]
MSDNKQMQNTENTNEWTNWIEEAIDKEHSNHYEYNQFTNIQEIGSGCFGKVYRANWKNTKKRLALKTFFNLNHVTMKEIVCELKIQRKVDFHDNIIRCHGITKFESDNQIGNNDYIMFSLNEKSDVYSVGVFIMGNIQWPTSFYAEGEEYDVSLILEISQGLRETVVLDTPEEYVKIYTKCWDGEPDNRPTIYQVVDLLKAIITKTDIIKENPPLLNEQEFSEIQLNTNNSESQGELFQLI